MKPVKDRLPARSRAAAKYQLKVQLTNSQTRINWLLDQWKENFDHYTIQVVNGRICIIFGDSK